MTDRVLDKKCTEDQLLEYEYILTLRSESKALIHDASADVRRTALETYCYACTMLNVWWRKARHTYALPVEPELSVDLSSGYFLALVPS